MADTEIDIRRLFINEASFLGGSIRRQMGFGQDTIRLLIHNDSDDTLAFGVSDDSLQLLLAGTQIATGDKTWQGVSTFEEAVNIDNDKILSVGTGLKLSWTTPGFADAHIESISTLGHIAEGYSFIDGASKAWMTMAREGGATVPNVIALFSTATTLTPTLKLYGQRAGDSVQRGLLQS